MAYKVPKNAWLRSKEILGLAAKLGREEISFQIKRAVDENPALQKIKKQVNQAQDLAESLSRLKGAAMKVGQLLSIDTSDYLPAEVKEVLSKLQNQSPYFMELAHIESLLKSELGEEKYARIEKLSSQPLAAASIGQVHSATIEGQSVAIKIQYPGVADSIDTDLSLLKKMISAFLIMSQKTIPMDELFHELSDQLKRETDYIIEAESMKKFKAFTLQEPYLRVPSPLDEFSTKKILTMTFMPGLTLKEWLKENHSFEEKQHFSKVFLDLYTKEFFAWNLVQTDPNFSNFFIEGDQMILLDFGAVKSFTPEFVSTYSSLIEMVRSRRKDATFEFAVEMGLVDARESEECKEAFYRMMTASLSAFDADKQPFNFSDSQYFKNAQDCTLRFTRLVKFSPPPHSILFLHRKLSGVFNALKIMDAKIDISDFWNAAVSV